MAASVHVRNSRYSIYVFLLFLQQVRMIWCVKVVSHPW